MPMWIQGREQIAEQVGNALELKPCPWCGGRPKFELTAWKEGQEWAKRGYRTVWDGTVYVVADLICHAKFYGISEKTKDQDIPSYRASAIEAANKAAVQWNDRPFADGKATTGEDQ